MQISLAYQALAYQALAYQALTYQALAYQALAHQQLAHQELARQELPAAGVARIRLAKPSQRCAGRRSGKVQRRRKQAGNFERDIAVQLERGHHWPRTTTNGFSSP